MNKRPHPGLSLPAKPYAPPQAGPAPPLPAGPPPAQQPAYPQDQQAAHAAAWAAYYQSQAAGGAGAGYTAAAAQPAASTAAPPNPYANYGYGAGAQHAQSNQPSYNQQGAGYNAGAGYNQPASPAQGYGAPQYGAQAGYTAGGGAPYTPSPAHSYGGQAQAPGYGAYNGGGHQSPTNSYHNQQGAGYTPQPPQPYFPQQQQQQGQGGGGFGGGGGSQANQPYRPSGPGNASQNRPYTPQPGPPGRGAPVPARPPAPSGGGGPGPGGPGGFPPAKRPRFDGPGGAGPGGPAGIPPRPPSSRGGPPQGYGSGMARPMGGGGGGRGGGPMGQPSVPRMGFNNPRGGGPMRGGMGGRGGAPMRGGMMGRDSRGPPLRRDRNDRNDRDRERDRDRDRGDMRPPVSGARRVDALPQQRDRKRKDKVEKEAKTTMTDFRIVGIEVKELDWTWGLIGEHVVDEVQEEKKEEDQIETKTDDPAVEVKTETEEDSAAAVAEIKNESAEVKEEAAAETKPEVENSEEPKGDEATAGDALDEKRGEKRKAKPSSVDGDVENGSPKKRSTFAITHGKANTGEAAPTSSPESNQNRFRIYFESPPELDRVPKASRRNPNKRWRRESSSVAPSRMGEHEEHHEEHPEGDHHDHDDEHEAAPETEAAVKVAPAPEQVEEKADEEKVDAPATTEPSAEAVPESAAETTTEPPAEPATESAAEPAAEPAAEHAPVTETAPEPAEAAAPESAAPEGPADKAPETAEEDVGDVSMITNSVLDESDVTEHASGLTGAEASSAELEAALAASAHNAASAYGNRGKQRTRRWSSSSAESLAESFVTAHASDVAQPSVNRVSVLYEDSTRRLVFDASVVRKVRIFRGEGRIEVEILPEAAPAKQEKEAEEKEEGKAELDLPKGVLVETYDATEQRFVAVTRERLDQLWLSDTTSNLPPLHRVFTATPPGEPITLTVFLNKKKPLSEPKWCRTNQADEWLYEQFGRRAGTDAGWRGKLEIVDPDAPPTLASILETWKSGSTSGTPTDRTDFTASLLASPNDLLEILLRLTRGDRNPAASVGTGPSSANGPLATAIRSDSPYASHQTHVSLAILAMYRLTTDYAEQAGVKTEVLNEKIADIIKSLPTHMIHKSLDGLYKEWLAERKA